MHRRREILTLLLLGAAAEAQVPEGTRDPLRVAFAVDVTRPAEGRLRVSMTLENNRDETVRVAIPAWAPGAYRIVRYARNVRGVRAEDPGGGLLEVRPVDEQTWEIRAGKRPRLRVSYEVAAERSRLDADHCFLEGPATYFYVVDRKEAPCRVRFLIPEGWKIATPLEQDGEEYGARDYDTFIDAPTELGRFDHCEFDQDGTHYEMVLHSTGPVDGPRLVEMCRKIVREQNRMFPPRPPFDRYVFLYHFRGGTGGHGLEHLNSTHIVLPYAAVRADPLVAASITSHEYFHAWNVKRIRPRGLGPFDYTGPVRTRALWFCEGGTSYFGDRALARCGIWDEARYFRHLAGEIEALQNNPDRLVTSVEQASWTVWDRKDYPRVDYYNKGELLSLLIDLSLRVESRGAKTFDDVLRYLYATYVLEPAREGKGWIGVGFPEDGILGALNAVSGRDWGGFYGRYVRGVEELPYREVLGAAGLEVDLEVARRADLGLPLRGTTVLAVPPGSEAERAGIRAEDRITAVDGITVDRATLAEVLGKRSPGDEVRLTLQRAGASFEAALRLGVRERAVCGLRRTGTPTDLQRAILNAWLGRRREY